MRDDEHAISDALDALSEQDIPADAVDWASITARSEEETEDAAEAQRLDAEATIESSLPEIE